MSQTGGQSALEPNVQFLIGFNLTDREGRFKAPASGTYDDGWLVKMGSLGTHWETCGDNDATHIFEQPVGTGPIASAATREKYTQGIPQNIVGNGAEITVMPIDGGRLIRTSIIWDGSTTGALDTSTAVGTQVESYNGKWREVQGANTAKGEIQKTVDSNGFCEIYLY